MQKLFLSTFFSIFSRRIAPVLLSFTLLIVMSSCGYKLHTEMPSILGDGTKTLKVKTIDYPTLDAWLPYSLRSSLRDEVNAMQLAKWVDSGSADYEISIKVLSFTSHEWMHDENLEIVLFNQSLEIEATIFDGHTNKEIWKSGTIRYDDRQETDGDDSTSKNLIQQVIRELCSKLRNSF